jgi:RNA polymerase sigma factor (TIGR02999 family)
MHALHTCPSRTHRIAKVALAGFVAAAALQSHAAPVTSWELAGEFNDQTSSGPVWSYGMNPGVTFVPISQPSNPADPCLKGDWKGPNLSNADLPLIAYNVKMTTCIQGYPLLDFVVGVGADAGNGYDDGSTGLHAVLDRASCYVPRVAILVTDTRSPPFSADQAHDGCLWVSRAAECADTRRQEPGCCMAGEITEAVARLQSGEEEAVKHLFAVSYDELKRLARARLWAANLKHGCATESLVHESYMRLSQLKSLNLPDRRHYFAYASKVMRSVILDAVREAQAERRGGGVAAVTLDTGIAELHAQAGDVHAVNDALKDLQRLSPDLAALVEMRFFGGLSEAEIAEALDVSERTVRREWAKARAALLVLLEDG